MNHKRKHAPQKIIAMRAKFLEWYGNCRTHNSAPNPTSPPMGPSVSSEIAFESFAHINRRSTYSISRRVISCQTKWVPFSPQSTDSKRLRSHLNIPNTFTTFHKVPSSRVNIVITIHSLLETVGETTRDRQYVGQKILCLCQLNKTVLLKSWTNENRSFFHK